MGFLKPCIFKDSVKNGVELYRDRPKNSMSKKTGWHLTAFTLIRPLTAFFASSFG